MAHNSHTGKELLKKNEEIKEKGITAFISSA